MSTFPDRPHSAVLVVDFQVGVVAGNYQRERIQANVKELVAKARAAGVPVIWVQDVAEGREIDSEPWQIVADLGPLPDEPRVQKRYGDSFEDTELADLLAAGGVGRLYVAGAQTDACIRSTIHGAFTRGYDTILVGDAHTTEDLTEWGSPPPADVIAHTNLYWTYHEGPGRVAGVVNTADLQL
jgi:Amidases related to nicotinamidase